MLNRFILAAKVFLIVITQAITSHADTTRSASVKIHRPSANTLAQSTPPRGRVRPPDLLGEDTVPADKVSRAAGDQRVDENPEAIESDKEPVPIIRREKGELGARPQSRYIEHPNAAKGLIRIDKDKVYHYKVKNSEQKMAGNFKIAVYDPTNLSGDDGEPYSEVYDESKSPLILYDHEWQIFQGAGKLGLTAGGGFFFASGHGVFKTPTTDVPREKFTFLVFPVNIGVIYRAEFYDTQPIAPYAGAGVGGMLFAERRDDDLNPALGARFGASPIANFYVGGALQLGHGANSFLDLDREYGINKIWLTAEYRRYVYISGAFDFSGDAINGGLSAEF